MSTRREQDLLGEKEIPANAPWGIHTERALENFPMAGSRVSSLLIAALAQVKKACALANKELGLMEPAKADAIIYACEQIEADPDCPLPALQGGAGTSSNMFVNEMIANKGRSKYSSDRRCEPASVHQRCLSDCGESRRHLRFTQSIRTGGKASGRVPAIGK